MARVVLMHKPKDAKGAFLRMVRYLAVYRGIFLLIVLLCLSSNVLALLGPMLAGLAINEASAGAGRVNFPKVYDYAGKMFVFYLTSSLLTLLINVIMMHVSKKIAVKMRQDVFDKLMRIPVGYFDRTPAGDIISRVSYDIDVVATCLGTDITAIMTSLITVVGSFGMMLYISRLLSLVVIVTIPVSVLFTVYMRGITQPRYSRRSDRYGNLNGYVEEMLSGQKTIQAYAYEEQIEEEFAGVNKEAADAYYNADYYGITIGPTMGMINNFSLSFIAVLGSLLYMSGLASLGQISSFILYSRKFTGPINETANIINEIFSALSAAERVFALLDEEEEEPDRALSRRLDEVKGEVGLENVSFGYTPGVTILHNLTLNARAGSLTAIVGPTGAGKTTIINLLMRFYDVDAGSVCVDGCDIRDYTRESLRKAYAMVLQDTWVFQGTVYENIAYGKEGATRQEVEKAAKAARIHPFIMRLPQGYDTVLKEDGSNISKGQKQLLTIARAMLYDSKMLILDEATSNVDTGTERQVQAAMRDLMKEKTCFVIAHRLSTIQHADQILVVNRGDVVEQGTHESLMKKRGFYYTLYTAQFD